MNPPAIEVLLTPSQIATRIGELGAEIASFYGDQPFVMLCVLYGAMPFFTDLARAMPDAHVKFATLRLQSYRGAQSSGEVAQVTALAEDIHDTHVLIVEDIVDTGRSLHKLHALLTPLQPRSLRSVALLDKPDKRVVSAQADWTGFIIPDRFVVGYGLDLDGAWRNLPCVGVLSPAQEP